MAINMMNQLFLLWLFLLLVQLQGLTGGVGEAKVVDYDNECKPTSCSDGGPSIRFPFWLKGHQPNHCGYPSPGFDLFCSQGNQTMLQLPFSVSVLVMEINYAYQFLLIQDPDSCFMRLLPNLSLSASPFQYQSNILNISLFSCPSQLYRDDQYRNVLYPDAYYYPSTRPFLYPFRIPCFSSPGHVVYAVQDSDALAISIVLPLLLSCRKMFSSSIPYPYTYPYEYPNYRGNSMLLTYYYSQISLSWSKPICQNCEESGKYCKLRNKYSSREHNNATECFGMIPIPSSRGPTVTTSNTSGKLTTGEIERVVIPTGLFLLLVIVIAMYFVHRSNKLKKEDQVKVERFLEDYRTLKPTRYTYSEIKKFTNKFKDKLGQGGYGTVYKGKLSNDVHIAAKILNNFKGNGDEFINEVGTIGRIHHVNVVRLVGYCADGFKRALVYEYLPNDNLQKFIPSGHQETCLLGWKKMYDIAVGIAKGIEYLHQGCDQRILHFDIKPHNVLLDHNFNPKISDFGLAKLCSKEQSAVSMTAARGTVGYIAPEVFSRNFGNVSYKSDVYSFGMLLLEMVGGRKNTNTNVTEENTSEVYFPEWIYNNLNHRIEEHGIQIEEDGDAKIVKKLTIVGLWCIQWYPGDRPAMKVVVQMLEGDGDTLALPPNPFSTTHSVTAGPTIGGRPYSSSLEVISESE